MFFVSFFSFIELNKKKTFFIFKQNKKKIKKQKKPKLSFFKYQLFWKYVRQTLQQNTEMKVKPRQGFFQNENRQKKS